MTTVHESMAHAKAAAGSPHIYTHDKRSGLTHLPEQHPHLKAHDHRLWEEEGYLAIPILFSSFQDDWV